MSYGLLPNEKGLQLIQLLIVEIRDVNIYLNVEVAFLARIMDWHSFTLNHLYKSRLCDTALFN
jgi:hypothetical protein